MKYLSAVALLLPGLVIGCGDKKTLNKAQAAVETCLNAWKDGGDPAQLVDQNIEIVDPDWQKGSRLLDFSVKNTSTQPQQGPRVVVVLNLQTKAGKKMDTEIAYEVFMKDKKIEIGRDPFHIGP